MSINPLIHIGYHKTGTTWLQNDLFVHGNSIFEPFSMKKSGHSSIGRHFVWDVKNYREKGYMLSPFDMNEPIIKDKISEIFKNKDFTGKIPVISSERLSGPPYAGGYDAKTIASRLKFHFPKAKILIVIREQTSMLLSMYLQYLYIGGFQSISKFLKTKYDGRLPTFSPNHFIYNHLINDYQQNFGADNVLILPYEMFKDYPTKFFEYLSDFVGKEIRVSLSLNNKYNTSNEKYIYYVTRYLNLLSFSSSVNAYSPLVRKPFRKFVNTIRKFYLPILTEKKVKRIRSKLLYEISENFTDVYREHNKKLSTLINIDLKDYGYY